MKCFNCQGMGHKAYECNAPKRVKQSPRAPVVKKRAHGAAKGGYGKKVKTIGLADQEEEEEEVVDGRISSVSKADDSYLPSICTITPVGNSQCSANHNVVSVYLNNQRACGLIDSGADISVMGLKLSKKLGLTLMASTKRFKSANDSVMRASYTVSVNVAVTPDGLSAGKSKYIQFMVFGKDGCPEDTLLLGTNFIEACDEVMMVGKLLIFQGIRCQFGRKFAQVQRVAAKEEAVPELSEATFLEELDFYDEREDAAFAVPGPAFDFNNVTLGPAYHKATLEQQQRIRDIFWKYRECMSEIITGEPKLKFEFEIEANIRNEGCPPPRQESAKKRTIVSKNLQEMLDLGIVDNSDCGEEDG